jgi:hypothetical protein
MSHGDEVTILVMHTTRLCCTRGGTSHQTRRTGKPLVQRRAGLQKIFTLGVEDVEQDAGIEAVASEWDVGRDVYRLSGADVAGFLADGASEWSGAHERELLVGVLVDRADGIEGESDFDEHHRTGGRGTTLLAKRLHRFVDQVECV